MQTSIMAFAKGKRGGASNIGGGQPYQVVSLWDVK
jgi:hypothetical protein